MFEEFLNDDKVEKLTTVGGKLFKTRNLSCHIDVLIHAGITLYNPVTLTFNLLTSESTHAEYLLYCTTLGVDSSSRFSLERGHTTRPAH